MKFNKFMPLAKMEEQTDGTLNVFGIVTAEQPDLDNEVCDYEGTKPFYQAKVAAMLKLTSSVAGMEPSIMPMREMHQLKAIGAGRTIEFDDATKTIRMGFNVVDPVAIVKFKKGVLIGFSQGGSYVGDKVADPVHKGCYRYVSDPGEVSGVDSPCLPTALVESMKGRTVSLMKASGTTEQIQLQTEVAPAFDLLANEKAVRGALSSADRPADARKAILAAAKKCGITLSDADRAVVTKACATMALKKGMYEVGWLASFIEDLHWLCLQTEFERDMEEDGSKVPEGLREAWMSLLAEFKVMAIEEADELAAQGGKGEKGMKITDQAGLTKAAKTIHDHLSKLAEMHKAHGEAMDKAHEAMKAKHDQLGEHIDKCMKAAKDASEGEEPEKAAPTGEVNKAVTDELDALKKSIADLTAKLATTPAVQPPNTGAGGPQLVEKSATISADFAELVK